MAEPIVGAALWRRVMAAAGYRCQCAGQCGNPHTKGEGRCLKEHDKYASRHSGPVRLLAAAADPATPPRAAALLPVADLRAWCPTCFDATRRAAQRLTRAAPDPAQGGLFDL
ncbi:MULTISPECIES: hypothetical protein [Streptomyces]|uniref:HNH endonuclease n=2 Tax=Streptomyces TaxID=1883 RepID=A0A420V1Q0_9ACTN|nr:MULTISPECIES: hypothetical protein [Streptomyces]KNE81650.1 hypothetical protein ADZ36_15695 [Streptomyces fradiae]OFA49607.1 hypothetical protein BEN35_17360 [Streptomyces fradiae]PQM21664.1 hypothetical protein Sfr7A_20790 [Streptomyces xinghaiensis]RKM94555.1 hypothetical protein SFRA_018290 [Streptomyces xinghaiensis]RNC72154.1 hypothetical protein DC095_020490 [Streptomyces xinghaiensis]